MLITNPLALALESTSIANHSEFVYFTWKTCREGAEKKYTQSSESLLFLV